MNSMISFVSEVEDAISSGDPIRRVDMLRKMTDLFIDQAPSLRELHVSVFDEVILRLARDLEFRARVELADRLADVANAPRRVVRDLALDPSVEVAAPVLTRSERLDEDDLATVARERGQDHLVALSQRRTLSERLTDILVDRGDRRVVRAVAQNAGARFSEHGFGYLMNRARQDQDLQEVLAGRSDIPPACMARLIGIAREKARETLCDELGTDAEQAVDDALATAASQAGGLALGSDFKAAIAAVELRARTGSLNEDDVVAWIKAGQVEEALAAMAKLAGIPVEMAARAFHASHYDPLLFIVRALKFGRTTFQLLLSSKAGRPLGEEAMRSAFEGFQQLSVQTAQRVVRFTAVRERAAQPDAA